MKARFPIGLTFELWRGKDKKLRTITDILTTTNQAGEVVSIRYQTQHEFFNQLVTDSDVTDTAIARSLGNEGIKPYL